MNEEEAIEILIELSTFDYVKLEDGDTAIETVLNLIEKQQAEIEDLKAMELKAKGGAVKVTLEGLVEIEKEIKKRDLEITSLQMEHKHDIKMIDEVKGEAVKLYNEIEKKNKIINLMANHIATSDSDLCQYLDITAKCKYYAGENKKTCDNCIKEYFERKIEQ